MTFLIQNMIQSSLSTFASQFKSDSGGKGESFLHREPSPDHVDPSEGEEGELASDEEDPGLDRGDPNLTQLVLTEEEQRNFESFPSRRIRNSIFSSSAGLTSD